MLSRVAENLYWLGRYLERAEDTARIVNVNAHLLLDLPKGIAPGWKPIIDVLGDSDAYRERHGDFEERNVVRFMVADGNNSSSILQSLSAYQMYRQRMQVRVRRADALRFLLQDYAFPRSFLHCVTFAQSSVAELPRNEAPLRAIGRVERAVKRAEAGAFTQDELHEFIDRLQIGLAQVHEELARTYFLVEAPAPESG